MLCAVALATGCALPASVEVDGSGVSTGLQVQTITCGPTASVERYLAGAGGVGIEIFDGDGRAIYDDNSGVAGETDDSHALDGAFGDWRLAVDAGGFAGQFKITLSCD